MFLVVVVVVVVDGRVAVVGSRKALLDNQQARKEKARDGGNAITAKDRTDRKYRWDM